jgi:hypothetical protein
MVIRHTAVGERVNLRGPTVCLLSSFCVEFRERITYYSRHGNSSLSDLYNGANINISMEEIYAVDYNSSVYQFQTPAGSSEPIRFDVVEIGLTSIYGSDGKKLSNKQLGLSLLTSNAEKCASFEFLSGKGVQRYNIKVKMFAEQGINPSLRGSMSLPNQARSFDRYRLFPSKFLPEDKLTVVEYSVHSPKFLQKRNTKGEPCVDSENYDKVI